MLLSCCCPCPVCFSSEWKQCVIWYCNSILILDPRPVASYHGRRVVCIGLAVTGNFLSDSYKACLVIYAFKKLEWKKEKLLHGYLMKQASQNLMHRNSR